WRIRSGGGADGCPCKTGDELGGKVSASIKAVSEGRDFRGWQGDADSWLRIIMPTNPLIMAAKPHGIEARFNLGFRHVEAALFSHAIIERMPIIDLFAWFFKFLMNLDRAIGGTRMLRSDL